MAPATTGKCVILEFSEWPLFMFFIKSGPTTPANTGKRVFPEFGTRAPLIGFLIKSGYRAPASTGACVSLEFGTCYLCICSSVKSISTTPDSTGKCVFLDFVARGLWFFDKVGI